jgi:NAD dependent epimerase/dehydratase family
MKVFLAGGTGVVGERLIPRLIDADHDVVATTHCQKKAEQLRQTGAHPAVVDRLDESAVVMAVGRAEPEVVIHEMTALEGAADLRHWDRWFATTNELRTRGTDHLIRAAQLGGARRFIAQSFTGRPNVREGGPVKTEADPLDPRPPAAMAGRWKRFAISSGRSSAARASKASCCATAPSTAARPWTTTPGCCASESCRSSVTVRASGPSSTSTTRPPQPFRPSTGASPAHATSSTTSRLARRSGFRTSPSW